MKKMHQITFEIDADTDEPVQGTTTLDGVKYDVTVTPAGRLERLRKLNDKIAESHDPAISLGPRGGGCPYCGR